MKVTNNPVKFPAQLYVGFSMRREDDDTITRLGFATPVAWSDSKTEQNAFAKRKSTVDSWAQYHTTAAGEVATAAYETVAGKRQHVVKVLSAEDANYPITINNELIEGFKIQSTHKRWGGWFSNKTSVWRVLDPRGFELEIYAANLAFIMNSVGILPGGIISGKCKWGRDHTGKNVLVPEKSDTYQLSLDLADKKQTQTFVPLKDVPRGTIVKMEGIECVYRGNTQLLSVIAGNRSSPTRFAKSTRYVFTVKTQEGENIFFRSSPKIESIIAHIKGFVSPENTAALINKAVLSTDSYYGLYAGRTVGTILFAHHSKSYLDKCTAEIVARPLMDHNNPNSLQIVSQVQNGVDRHALRNVNISTQTDKLHKYLFTSSIRRPNQYYKIHHVQQKMQAAQTSNGRASAAWVKADGMNVSLRNIGTDVLIDAYPHFDDYKIETDSQGFLPAHWTAHIIEAKISDGNNTEIARVCPRG